MKTRVSKIVCGIIFLIPLVAQAQNKIFGTVKDLSGKVVFNAKVSVVGLYSGTYTDKEGNYEIPHLADGEYVLKTTAFGHESVEQSVKLNGADLRLDVTLSSSSLMIEEVQVAGVRADSKTPTTYTNLGKTQISESNFGQDLPFLLQTTPSTVVTSDAGAGIGYTGVRIRGVDPTRTNVTINGIPINDAESHGMYWVNMPDFASSSESIQIQRGVGTSSNGTAAFGASLNIKSDNIQKDPYATSDNSTGSFNTLKTTVKAGTGLINNHFTLDARLSRVVSDGFIDRASSNLKAAYLSGAWIGTKSLLKANIFTGNEQTYQAWWGIPEWKYKGNIDSLTQHFYNNYYPGGLYQTTQDSVNLFDSKNNTYNYYTYENEKDSYQQDHYQLHFTHTFTPKITFNVSGHYTRGKGYYEQYRKEDNLSIYGLDALILGSDTITTTDLVRRRWLDNHFYGGLFSLNYFNQKNLKVIFGAGVTTYLGGHYGEITWARFASNSVVGDRYYESDAHKTDASGYLKANYQVKKINFFMDLQLRYIDYTFVGVDELYGEIIPLKQSVNYTFFNPKTGLMYEFNDHHLLYASFSIANREPVRSDFVENSAKNLPSPEQLQNLEIGYRFKSHRFLANVNYYLMNYKDQLILTGEINDVGSYIRTNVAKSYRSGIELEWAYKLLKNLSFNGNLNLSQNKILRFSEFIDNYDNYDTNGNMIQTVVEHTNTDIAFSPKFIAGIGLVYEPIDQLEVNLFSKYVGAQFLDNTSSENRKLDGYFTSNLTLNYTFKKLGVNELLVGILVTNLFDEQFVNNGYTWGYISGGKRTIENFYFPQAGRNFMVRLAVKF